MIGSRIGRERLPTGMVAHVANDALDDGPQLARRGADHHPRHTGCPLGPDRFLTVAVLNRRRLPPVDVHAAQQVTNRQTGSRLRASPSASLGFDRNIPTFLMASACSRS